LNRHLELFERIQTALSGLDVLTDLFQLFLLVEHLILVSRPDRDSQTKNDKYGSQSV
jgi:hypothetical protein